MMVRINLLPVRAVKKREYGRQVLILYGAMVLFTGVVNFIWYDKRNAVVEENKRQLDTLRADITKLEKIIGEVNNISKRKKEVEEKLRVLEQLRKGRSGPVRLLDALATAIPKKVWLTVFEEQNGQVHMQGAALSNDDVAEFMRGLQNVVWTPQGIGRLVEQKRDSKTSRVELVGGVGAILDVQSHDVVNFFTNIELKNTSQKSLGGDKVVDFDLGLTANYQT